MSSLATLWTAVEPRWPQTGMETFTMVMATLFSIGLATFFYLRIFHDWIADELIMMSRLISYMRAIKKNTANCQSEQLEQQAELIPNKVYLLFEDKSYTFAETNKKANQVANALIKMGVVPGTGVGLFMKNKPEYLFICNACLKIAAPLAFLNTNVRSKALIHSLKVSSVKVLLVDNREELLSCVDDVYEQLKDIGVRVLVYGPTEKYENLSQVIDQCKTNQPDTTARANQGKDEITQYLFTSGTTGLPKAVKVTKDKTKQTFAMYYLLGMRLDDVLYAPLPLYHANAMFHANCALFLGLTFVSAPKFSASRFWQDCIKHKVTVIQYVGETCRYLLSRPASDLDRKHRVRMAAGNGLRKEIWKEFTTRFGIKTISEIYGATDGADLFVNVRNKLGSCGRRHPYFMKMNKSYFIEYDFNNGEIKRGEDGFCKMVARGEPGLLITALPEGKPFDVYTSEEDNGKRILKNVFKDGDQYIESGDVLLWDTDYHLYFVDRVGDSFRWKGENVSTQEVGNLICTLENIEDCTVYSMAVPGMEGRCGMAAIALKAGLDYSEDLVKSVYDHCERYLTPSGKPVFIRFVPEMSLTGTYKHQKTQFQQEGFNPHKVKNVYVRDVELGTYTPLTSDVYEKVISQSMRI